MMLTSGRSQQQGCIAFKPHIILIKDTIGSGISTLYVQLNNLNKRTQYVSSQYLLRIHVFHIRWSLHQIYILRIWRPHQNYQGPNLQLWIRSTIKSLLEVE